MAVVLRGTGTSEGAAMAKLLRFTQKKPEIPRTPAEDPEAELERLGEIFAQAREELKALYQNALEKTGKAEAAIFDAHLTLLEDEYSVYEPISERIRSERNNAAMAISLQFDELAAMFRSLGDELMAERAADAEDLKTLLLRIALGTARQDLSHLDCDVILLAGELTPSDTVRMDAAHVRGIATTLGGVTSHSAIIARTLGIPAVTGISGWETIAQDGTTAILDGTRGTLVIDPEQAQIDAFRSEKAAAEAAELELEAYRCRASATRDGTALELCGNIGTPGEAQTAFSLGADGIGLFRSEFLFMDRKELPTEEEQYLAYRQALEAMQGKPVIVRTLDIGGDKKLPALPLPQEENPFLGYRAIRMTLDRQEIFRPQLRALLRASVHGDLRIMFPMISCMDELRRAKALLEQERNALQQENVPVAPVRVGMMIEIPAAAVLADCFAKEVDFFSIGTNDLIQYTVAAERGNENVAHLYSPSHPAVLRLIAATASAARENGIPCGMCGEAAGDEKLAPAFVGMGVTELSMSPRRIAPMRRLLGTRSMAECEKYAQELLRGEKF